MYDIIKELNLGGNFMKLYMKQKVFSWKDKFHIFDENQEEKFYAESEVFTLGKKLHLYNNAKNEVCFIHQKVFSFLPRYFVNINGEDRAEVVKKFTFFKHEYIVNGIGWQVHGDFLSHEYTIENNGFIVANISKKWLSWGDTYEIDIANPQDEILSIAIVLIIDAIMAQEAAASASASASVSVN